MGFKQLLAQQRIIQVMTTTKDQCRILSVVPDKDLPTEQVERIIQIESLQSIFPGTSNSDEDLLSNCSTESAGDSLIPRKKNVIIASREGCPQCSNFVNFGCPKCAPSSRRNLQRRLQQSPAIGVAPPTDSNFVQDHGTDHPPKNSTCAFQPTRLRNLKDSRTYRPELWEVSRAVCRSSNHFEDWWPSILKAHYFHDIHFDA